MKTGYFLWKRKIDTMVRVMAGTIIDSHSFETLYLIEIKAVLVALRQRGAELPLLPLQRSLRAGECLERGLVLGLVRRPAMCDCRDDMADKESTARRGMHIPNETLQRLCSHCSQSIVQSRYSNPCAYVVKIK